MKVSGKMVESMVKEFKLKQMEINTKVSGRTIKCMVKEL